jgi:hypothetical protein
MRATGFRRRIAAWFGALAIALSPLAPALSGAKSVHSDPLSDLCTAAGLQPGSAPDQAPGAPSHQLEHCAYCSGVPGFGALAASALRVATSSDFSRAVFRSDPSALPTTSPLRPRPRAPPALS